MTDPTGLFRLDGKSAIITGATGALGTAASRALGAMGARLTLAAGSEDDLDALEADLAAAGHAVTTVARRPDSLSDAEAIADAARDVDILICAAGTNLPARIEDMSVADWETVMDANVRGSWLMCKAVGPRMIARGKGGKVVLISSVRGRHGSPLGYSSYCTSKAAVDGLTRALALEWGGHGINVNAIGPNLP